jgi:hypothetical protein
MPTSDTKRRVDEFKRFPEELRFVEAKGPVFGEGRGNAVIGLVYLVDGENVRLSEELLQPLINEWPEEFWDERPERMPLNVVSTGFAVGSVQLGLLLGFPACNLREDGPVLLTPPQHRMKSCSIH